MDWNMSTRLYSDPNFDIESGDDDELTDIDEEVTERSDADDLYGGQQGIIRVAQNRRISRQF